MSYINYLTLVISIFLWIGCGTSKENPNRAVDGITSLNSGVIQESKLINKRLTFGNVHNLSGFSESDFYFYDNGLVDYQLRSLSGNSAIIHLQWQIEGNSIYVNNGNRTIGTGLLEPKELKFLSLPSLSDVIQVKYGNSVFNDFKILVFETVTPPNRLLLSENNFIGKTLKYSVGGSTFGLDITTLTFDRDFRGVDSSGAFRTDFVWSLFASNKLKLEFENGKNIVYTFSQSPKIGSQIDAITTGVIGSSIKSAYVIVGYE